MYQPTKTITNADDIIDSRDVIARIEELESERDAECEGETDEADEAARVIWAEDNPDDAKELAALQALAEECEGYSDWQHGEILIRDSYFEEYARDLADDIGAIPADARWPLTCIDWEQAARELQYDYSLVSFDGVDYWIRSC